MNLSSFLLASSALWRLSPFFFLIVAACGPTVVLPDPVTCPSIKVSQNSGECDLVADQLCSDNLFYEVNCGDDSTCTCIQDGNLYGQPVLAGNMTSGFCAKLDASQLHHIAALCGLNLNP